MPSPLISVVMPSFNHGKFIGEAIESILTQGCDTVELIVADGGSTDGTLEVLQSYQDKLPLRWTSKPDNGLYDALNAAIAVSRGEWVGWLNTDDCYAPGVFRKVVERIREARVEAICGDAELFETDSSGARVTLRHFAHYRGDRICATPENLRIAHLNACFFKRSLLEKLGPFATRYRIAGDRDYLLRILREAPPSCHLETVVCQYRCHAGSLTMPEFSRDAGSTRVPESSPLWGELRQIADEHFNNPGTPKKAREWCRRQLVWLTVKEATDAFLSRQWRHCLSTAGAGARLDPLWPARFARALSRRGISRTRQVHAKG
jgi:glycosyltransferase involved in cell wall biosynthesis